MCTYIRIYDIYLLIMKKTSSSAIMTKVTTCIIVSCGLLLLTSLVASNSGYQNCIQDPEHVLYENYCYLVLPVVHADKILYEVAMERCRNSGGYLAIVTNPELGFMLENKTLYFGYVGLRQEYNSTSPKSGWYWFKGNKTWNASFLDEDEPRMWSETQPNDSPGPDEMNRENYAGLYHPPPIVGFGKLFDLWGGSYPTNPVCQYDVPRKKFKGVVGRSGEQGVIETSFMDNDMSCCYLCWESPLCQSFSYNTATNSCLLHRFYGNDPAMNVIHEPTSIFYSRQPDLDETA